MSLFDARQALDANAKLLSATHQPILRNLNTAFVHICAALDALQQDVGLLHAKLQPVLKEISGDDEYTRVMTRKGYKQS